MGGGWSLEPGAREHFHPPPAVVVIRQKMGRALLLGVLAALQVANCHLIATVSPQSTPMVKQPSTSTQRWKPFSKVAAKFPPFGGRRASVRLNSKTQEDSGSLNSDDFVPNYFDAFPLEEIKNDRTYHQETNGTMRTRTSDPRDIIKECNYMQEEFGVQFPRLRDEFTDLKNNCGFVYFDADEIKELVKHTGSVSKTSLKAPDTDPPTPAPTRIAYPKYTTFDELSTRQNTYVDTFNVGAGVRSSLAKELSKVSENLALTFVDAVDSLLRTGNTIYFPHRERSNQFAVRCLEGAIYASVPVNIGFFLMSLAIMDGASTNELVKRTKEGRYDAGCGLGLSFKTKDVVIGPGHENNNVFKDIFEVETRSIEFPSKKKWAQAAFDMFNKTSGLFSTCDPNAMDKFVAKVKHSNEKFQAWVVNLPQMQVDPEDIAIKHSLVAQSGMILLKLSEIEPGNLNKNIVLSLSIALGGFQSAQWYYTHKQSLVEGVMMKVINRPNEMADGDDGVTSV